MYETHVMIVGTAISDPRFTVAANRADRCSFRMVAATRRVDRSTGDWFDGAKLYLTVLCWRRMAPVARDAVHSGMHLLVRGELRTNEYVTAAGEQRKDLELHADAIGLDLARAHRSQVAEPETEAAAPAPA